MRMRILRSVVALLLVFFATESWAEKEPGTSAQLDANVFAVIDGVSLDAGVFVRRLLAEMRQTFYHGRIPEDEAAPFRLKIANQLVDEFLLAQEARRRGLMADPAELERRWSELDRRSAARPEWADARDRLKPMFTADWERQLLAESLLAQVRNIPSATDVQAREYYASHLDLFTRPASHRLSIILLGVDPGAGEPAWVEAEQRAEQLYNELQKGADFSELAELHSTDYTADQGGDMGVIHAGMVGDDVQALVEKMQPGDVAKPMRLLQGVALFKLVDRTDAVQQDFDAVRERAAKLWHREQSDLAAELLRFELRQASVIELNEALVALPVQK